MVKNQSLKIIRVIIVAAFAFSCASKQTGGSISNADFMMQKRLPMFDAVIKEIERVDADRNDILKLKGESWDLNIKDLRAEVEKARTPQELGLAFKKIDSLYPHVQSQQILNPDLENVPLGSKISLPFKMMPTIKNVDDKNFSFFISQVSKEGFTSGPVPQVGDEVVEINKKGMDEWEQENFTLCKSASHIVCALELNHNFRNENLAWRHQEPIELHLLRGGNKVTVNLKAKVEQSGGFEASESADSYNDVYPCGIDFKRRYFEFGFLYKGRRLCVLGSHAHPGVAVMRISNFIYNGNDDSIRSVRQEIEVFKKYTGTKTLRVSSI